MNFEYGLDRFCMQGNLKRVKELLSEGVDPNVANVFGNPLYLAVSKHYLEIAKELLLHKADPNIVNTDGDSCLNQAARGENLEMLKILLFEGIPANPNISKYNGVTSLHLASSRGRLDIVKQLFTAPICGADPNITDEDGETPLIWASINGHSEVIKLLLNNGANPDISDNDGETSLTRARLYNRSKVVEILEDYFPSLQNLSMRSIRKHRINIIEVSSTLFS